MRIIKDCNGELIKGIKTPISYEDGDIQFRYHLFIWLVDWEEASPTDRPPFRYYLSVRAVSLDLQSAKQRQRVIDSRGDTKNPSDYWGMTCDLLTDGVAAVLWESEGDNKPELLQSASEEVEYFKQSNGWAEYDYGGSLQSTMNQLKGEN